MKIDHLLRMGSGYDLVLAADVAIRGIDEDGDPAVDALVAELKDIQENFPPDEIAKQRRILLTDAGAEMAKEVREAERKGEPRAPFATSLINRFYNKRSGNVWAVSNARAERETGLSAKQTAQVAPKIAELANELQQGQEDRDAKLALGPDNGGINPKQWREARATDGVIWQGALKGLRTLLPKAAQVQDDPVLRARWNNLIFTMAGDMPDRRSKGQVLRAGFSAIPLKDIAPGIPDWAPWFAARDAYLDGLSVADRALLEEELDASRTNAEKRYVADLDAMRPYFTFAQDMAEAMGMLDDYSAWKGSDRQSQFLVEHPLLDRVLKLADTAKERMRFADPELAGALFRWMFTTAPLNPLIEIQNRLDIIEGQPVSAFR